MNQTRTSRYASRAAFTLIEILVVCAILGIVMTISIPLLYKHVHPDSMDKVSGDIMEACSHGRALAILNGSPIDLVFHAEDGQISLQSASGPSVSANRDHEESHTMRSPDVAGSEWRMGNAAPAPASGQAASSFTAKIPDTIAIEIMEVNFQDAMEWAEARVRFYPNGTSDELKLLLFRPESGERRLITLEVVTALADIESDPLKMR